MLNKRHTNVENKEIVRLSIRQEVLYLRIAADSIQDRKSQTRLERTEREYSHEIVTPLKGVQIREVKFYERL